MKVAVIGGGFTGLAAAYSLASHGHRVTVYEAGKTLGGLAYGFKEKNWDWHLEYAYHHWFTSDRAILTLVDELHLTDKLIISRPVTASLYNEKPYQLDSPMHLLMFPGLSIVDKLRTAVLLGFLKLNPIWKPLENITAEHLLISVGGKKSYKALWEPLLIGKFSGFAPSISAAWFWARIQKRTPRLMYMEGGFHTLVTALDREIKKRGGKVVTGKTLESIPSGYDRILLTTPTPIAVRLMPALKPYCKNLLSIPHLFAQTVILETEEPLLNNVYWLNVTDRKFPFLATVAHTNFMDKRHYGGHHLTYFGNYLPQGHAFLSMTKEQLMSKFMPYIKHLSPSPTFTIVNSFMFTGPFAQPVHQLRYSQKIPPIKTPVVGVYMANMDYIVPWDRGTNYAVDLGIRAAGEMMHE